MLLSERSQSEKDVYCMILATKNWERQNYEDTKEIRDCGGGR